MFEHGQHVQAGDTSLFVAEAGNKDGSPIVLLHGGLGSRHDFLPLARHLATQYRLIAIDSRGHGRSALGTRPMTYQQLEQDITAVVEALGLNAAGIIGHSDGGIVALRLAAAGRVSPRFVVAAGAHWDLPIDDPVRELYRGITAQEWRDRFGEQVARYDAENPDADFGSLFDATQGMWLGSGSEAYPGTSVRTITTPVLVVQGDDDFLVSRAQAFALVEQVKGARLLNLPFATHTVLEDDPESVLPALIAFISSLKP